ncbi:MAG TPA: cytochrome P450 [Streptosporangiaceae bacterium]|jgi:cytochrome P450
MNLVSELDLPVFDYSTPGFPADAYHTQLAALCARGWLARAPLAYIVLDHAAAEFFLRSRDTAFPGREIATCSRVNAGFGVDAGPLAAHIDSNILNLRGEQHRRLRSLAGHAFGPRAADRWRPVMRAFLTQLWARIGAYRECDFVPAIARPYPSLTIATVLGAPHQDAGRLHEWSSWVQRQFDISALQANLPEIERAVKEAEAYVSALIADRRAHPGDDLVSELTDAGQPGAALSDAECVSLVVNLLAGGIDTTVGQLARAIRLFAMHPAQWELLAERPVLAAAAVDEVLRFEPVMPFIARICLADLSYRDVLFPAGTILAICAERANREVAGGERFDITVPREGRLLTFGAGAHHCLGANLARAELEEALAFLAPRMASLRLTGQPRLGGVEGIYGIDKLLVTWSSS